MVPLASRVADLRSKLGTAWQGTLDIYVLRRFLFLYAGTLVSFHLVYVVVDLFENLDTFVKRSDTAGAFFSLAVQYYMAVLPIVFCQLLGPVVALTAGLFTVTVLQRANELVPMLANGRSAFRIFLPIIVAGFVLAGATFLLQEIWIPRTGSVIRQLTGQRGPSVVENQKYRDDKHGILVVVKRYFIQDRRAEGISVIPVGSIDRGERKISEFHIHARSMEWIEPELAGAGYWMLQNGRKQEYKDKTLVTRSVSSPSAAPLLLESFVEEPLKSSLVPADLQTRREDEVFMTLSDLRRKIAESVDRRWTIKYYSRFATPMSTVVLLLVGLPVILYYGSRNVFFGALVSALITSSFYIASSFAGNLGLRGVLFAPLGAWLGPLLFAAAGITCFRYVRV